MIAPLLCLLLCVVAQARVTFTHSEVLQDSDLLPEKENRAAFKCDNGCFVYTDVHANLLYITEWNEQTQYYEVVTNFNNIGGSADVQPLPDPYELKASKNYYIENRGEKNPNFVFYVVDKKAPNVNTPVMIITDDWGIYDNANGRMFTILSSQYESVRYTEISGTFQADYPRIYTTGADAVAEKECSPLYQSRSQASAELAAITVFSPISTVDFGSEGKHNARVQWNKDNQITKNGMSSTVYSSPGYVGCSYIPDQSYSARDSIQDTFKLTASSLDVNGRFHLQTAEDAFHLTVNGDAVNLFGSPSYTQHYDDDSYDVFVKWNRKLSNANFAVQLDFGLGKTGDAETTTTDDANLNTMFASMIVALMFVR